MTVTHGFVDVDGTTIHFVETGTGVPVLLLHQTPRSWDEYRDVLPLVGERRRAIAMDTAGFGDSQRLPAGTDSIERWAEIAVGLLDALGLPEAAVVGHHTGGYVATELAAAHPARVSALVLSGVALHAREDRLAHAAGRAVVDDVDASLDGSHLLELWRMRAPLYPPDVSLLERFMRDCLRAGDLAAEGHRVVARYPLDERVGLVTCPTLLVAPLADAYAFPAVPGLDAAIPHAKVTPIPGGMVPLPDQLPDAFAAAVNDFLDELG
ncbi:MAG: alpha/beta fold hydrolase [Gaiellales bacterium]